MEALEQSDSVSLYIGKRIKDRRKLLKLSQMQISELMGLSYQQMQKYENGTSQVSVSKLLKFSKILNVPITYFFDGIKQDENIGRGIETDIIQKTRNGPLRILLVEDNPGDIIFFKKALGTYPDPIDIHIIHDGEEVMDFLQNHTAKYAKPQPDLIILDLSLPKIGGMHVLKSIKGNQKTVEIPVIILTNSISKKEMREAYSRGAAGFVQKSTELEDFSESITTVMEYWSKIVALPCM